MCHCVVVFLVESNCWLEPIVSEFEMLVPGIIFHHVMWWKLVFSCMKQRLRVGFHHYYHPTVSLDEWQK